MGALVGLGRTILVALGVSGVVDRIFGLAASPSHTDPAQAQASADAVNRAVALTAVAGVVAGAALVTLRRRR